MHRILPVFLLVSVVACVPLPIGRIKGVSGTSKSEDYSFIRDGQTTRSEVLSQLGWMDSGISETRLFWGRWSSSKWVWVGGAPQLGFGAIRPASLFNLLVEFDATGVVERSRVVQDNDINRELLSWWKRVGRDPLSPLPSIGVMKVRCTANGSQNATLELVEGALVLRATTGRCDARPIVMTEIFRIFNVSDNSQDPEVVTLRIFYRDGLDAPELAHLVLTPADSYKLLKYVASAEAYIPAPWLSAPVPVAPDQGAIIGNFPRTTTLRWTPSPGAIAYIVQWDYSSNGVWSSDGRELPDFETLVPGPTYTFNFVGAQPGRWRVWPITAAGLRGNPSEWRTFRYTR